MSRIAFSQCGFEDVTDPRNFLPKCIEALTPGAFEGFFQANWAFTHFFVWRWAALKYHFVINWSDGVSSAAIDKTGTFTASWVFNYASPSESYIRCQTSIDYGVTEPGTPAGSEMVFRLKLGEFNEISRLFTYGVSGGFTAFAQPSPTVSFGFPFVGPVSGVSCTILGNSIPMFDVVGSATGSVVIEVDDNFGYWRYNSGGPPPGPIWDVNTGAQVLFPLPTGL